MNVKPATLAATVCISLIGCHQAPSQAERDLLRDWSASDLSPSERATVLNRFFTNGTPVATVVRVLGPDYIRVTPYSMVSLYGSPVMCWLEYTNKRVTIGTSARVGSGKDLLAASFTGAGYQLDAEPATNAPSLGQPHGAANRSQPIASQTNPASAAAGSGR